MEGTVFQTSAVMRLVDMISGPLRFVQGTMADTENSAAALGVRMGVLAQKMMPIAVLAGLLIGGLAASAMATVATNKALGELSSVGVRNLAALEQAGQDFSNTWAGTTKAQFIAAAYDIKSGISSLSDEGVAEFTKLSALTAKATKSTVGEMTTLFAAGYKGFKGLFADLSDMEFGEVLSAGLAASVQVFRSEGAQMAQAISALKGAATAAQVPLEEQFSVLGMLQGVWAGGEAGTAYKAFIGHAVEAGQKLKLKFTDANNQLLSMPEILTALKNKYGETLDAVEKLEIKKAFGTDEAVATIDILYGSVGDLTANIHSMSSAMQKGIGFTEAMAMTMNQDLGAVLQISGQRLHNLVEIIGKTFVPVMLWFTSALSGVTLFLQKIAASPIGSTILSIAGAIASATVAVFGLALAGAGLSAMLPIVTAQLAPIVAMVAGLTWPVWLLVGALGALYIAWRTNFGGLADIVDNIFGKVSLVFRALYAIFNSLTGSVGYLEGELGKEIKAAGLLGLVTTVARLVYRVAGFMGALVDGFMIPARMIGNILLPVMESLIGTLRPLWTIISRVVSALFGLSAATPAGPLRTFGEVLGRLAGEVLVLFAWSLRLVLTPLKLLADIVGFLLGGVIGLGEALGNITGFIVDFFSGANLFESGAKLIDTLVAGIKSRIMAPVEMVKAGFAKLRNLLPFSDAKEGPLAHLTLSGRKIMDTLGAGIRAAAPDLHKQAASALAGVALTTAVATQTGAVPPPSLGDAGDKSAIAASAEQGHRASSSKERTQIIIQHLNLSGVKDADGFVKALQQLVEKYDA